MIPDGDGRRETESASFVQSVSATQDSDRSGVTQPSEVERRALKTRRSLSPAAVSLPQTAFLPAFSPVLSGMVLGKL